jgi:hypothetical protein
VPLIVDGRRARFSGELRRYPAPSLPLWLTLLAGLLAAGAAALLGHRREVMRRAAIGFGVLAAGASVLIALAFAVDAYASPGTWIEGFDEIAFLAVGLGVLWRGPDSLHVGAAVGLGLVSLAVGLLKGAVFFHPVVLAVLPDTVMRLLVLVAIGAGLNAAVLGCLFFVEAGLPALDTLGFSSGAARAPDRPRAG